MRFLILLPTVLAATVSTGFCASADFVGNSSPFTVEKTTQIPGDTLKAGSYSITITEQIADRMIVRVDSTTNKSHAIFLGVPSSAGRVGGSGSGPVNWAVGVHKTPTVRGFVFANGNAVEFVYPKAEAAELTQQNATPVVAVDPKSEGRVALKNLSQDELQIVNLWLLSLTSTGAENRTPAVLAKHYDPTADMQHPTVASGVAPVYPLQQKQAPPLVASAPVRRPSGPSVAVVAPPVTQEKMVARSKPLAPPTPQARRVSPVRPESAAPVEMAAVDQPPMTRPAAARKTPALTQLPHTASSLPIVWLTGIFSLIGAGWLRFGRGTSRRLES